MDYFGLVGRSIELLTRHRAIWIFAIVLALFESSGSFNSSYRLEGRNAESFSVDWLPLILFAAAAIIVLAIVAFLATAAARGAIVAAIREADDGEDTSVSESWEDARHRFPTLLLLQFVLTIPFFVIIAAVFAVLGVAGFRVISELSAGGEATRWAGAGLIFLVLVLVLMILVTIVIVFVLQAVLMLATISVILENTDTTAAIHMALGRLWQHILAVIAITFLLGLLNGLAGFIIGIPAVIFVAMVAFVAQATPGIWVFGLIALVPVFLIALLVNTPFQAFRYTYWTLVYREWMRLDAEGPETVETAPSVG